MSTLNNSLKDTNIDAHGNKKYRQYNNKKTHHGEPGLLDINSHLKFQCDIQTNNTNCMIQEIYI